jgi:hypothetical protein
MMLRTRWHLVTLLLFVFFLTNLLAIKPALAQGEVSPDSNLVAGISALRSEISALQGELSSYVTGVQSAQKARRGKGFEAYRKQFEALGGKISSCRERLQYFHEQVSRLYRTMPTSPLYLAARQAYTDVKQEFDSLVTSFSNSPRPEILQIAEVRVMDGRLTKHLAQTAPQPAPVNPEQNIGRVFLEADDIRYIGKFDSVEVYLIIIKDVAHYVLTGLRERAVESDGQVTEVVRQTILYSEPFPSKQVDGHQTDQHFEKLLQQKFILLAEDENTTNLVMDELLKARSYARAE